MRPCRVVRDDGMRFATFEEAGARTYGACRRGGSISRACETGGMAGGHRWRYGPDYAPNQRGLPTNQAWTEEERRRLSELWPEHGRDWDGWASALPGHTPSAVEAQARSMGLRVKRRRNQWTKVEDAAILRTLLRLSRETGRTPGAIVGRLDALRRAQRAKEREGADGR